MKLSNGCKIMLIIVSLTLSSCYTKESILTPAALEVNAPNVPPGTMRVNDSLFVDRVPVTNLMYNEFLENLENYWNMKKHDRMQLYPRYGLSKDSVFQPWTGNTRLYMEATYENPNVEVSDQLKLGDYSKNPKYSYNPAIGLSKFQAELFCLWRSDLANAVFAIRSKSKSKRSNFPYKVTYRLPTQEEMLAIENHMRTRNRISYYLDDIFIGLAITYTFKELQESGNLVIMELNEIAKDGAYLPLFNVPLEYYEKEELKTGFRCICEVDKP